MPTITRRDTEDSRAVLTVHIAKEDYERSVNKKLNDFRKKAQLKGFRAGQVPMSYAKKVYGKQVLADELNDLAYKELINYIAESGMETIGQPLPSEDQSAPELNVKNYTDYEFEYEIGLIPTINLKGIDKSITLDSFDVEITDEAIQEEIDKYLKKRGERKEIDEVKSENDLLMVDLIELEGDEPKIDGINKLSMIAIEDIQDEKLKKKILKLKKGDTFDANIHELVAEDQQDTVRKYLLNVDEETEFNETFRAEISTITHIQAPEMNALLLADAVGLEKAEKHVAEFLPKEDEATENEELEIPEAVDAEKAVSKEEKEAAEKGMKEEIGLLMQEQYEDTASKRLVDKTMDKLLEINELPLPDSYFKRWLKINNKDKVITEKLYTNTAKTLRLSLILNAVAKHLGVYVSVDDIETELRENFYERGGLDPEDPATEEKFQQFYEQMLQYSESYVIQRQSQLNSDNVKEKLEEIIKVKKKKVSTKEFNDTLQAEYEEAKKKEEAESLKEEALAQVAIEG